MKMQVRFSILMAFLILASPAKAEMIFDGVAFPGGIASFADRVIAYSPVVINRQPNAAHSNPSHALGPPDWDGQGVCTRAESCNTVSLGSGGSIVLAFEDNFLTGSDSPAPDLWIFEIGKDVEDTFVEISLDGIRWHSVGKITGGTRGVDIDAFGWGSMDRFSFVRLTDDPLQGAVKGNSVGADIDAVGAISMIPVPDNAIDVRHLH